MKFEHLSKENYQEVLDLWNACLPADAISKSRFNERIIADENYQDDLSLVLTKNSEVIGYGLAIKRRYPYLDRGLEPDRGFINIFFIKKSYRQQGYGTLLIKELEKRLFNKGVERITVAAYSPNYFHPGIENNLYPQALSLLKKLDYEAQGEAVSMEINLQNYSYPKAIISHKKSLLDRGFIFRKYRDDDAIALLKFLKNNFGSGWTKNAIDSIRNKTAYNNIILCTLKEEIIGFTLRGIDGNSGRFGPFGVREDFQNQGLGSVLFHETMFDMKKQDIKLSYFLWTGGAAQRFYERHGMHPYRTFTVIGKNIR